VVEAGGALEEDVPPPTNRMLIAVLSLIGLFVALYLTAHALGWTGPLVCGVGNCEMVQSSKWAKVGSVPVALIGFLGYLALLALSFLGIQPGRRRSRGIGGLLLGGATIGFAFSAWLTYLEAFVIHAWCQWCVSSAILMTVIFVASLPELGRTGSVEGA
jgi:uncharacterized membrane protein